MKSIDKLLSAAKAEFGYLEKKSNSQLDGKTDNAGSNNYTKYARDLYSDLQAQPWCDMFVDWCFVQAFGQATAKELLCGGFSAYTPTSAQYFKSKGQYHKSNPKPGDQIFFKNSQRINHTGIVMEVTSTKVRTIEGNTSGGSTVVANGGGVHIKEYDLSNTKIDGYGRPDYSLVKENKQSGWVQEPDGWRYYLGDTGECIRDDWHEDVDGKWYWFDAAGIMAANKWYNYNEEWYYFGDDGAMAKGLQMIDGKCYYLSDEGKMITEPIVFKPDANGALWYTGPVDIFI